jgi:D-tagatose-1,6-bisphosphate aldolase subunit GatZ/KbaZ
MIDMKSLIDENRAGRAIGLPCFCTANAHVLRSILRDAAETGFPTVIEATCNQVNQDGGYTGMTADDFMSWVRDLARDADASMDQLVLGGDHLGPNPWRKEAADVAMHKARELVRQYAAAGFRKIHLDASMPCGGSTTCHRPFARPSCSGSAQKMNPGR